MSQKKSLSSDSHTPRPAIDPVALSHALSNASERMIPLMQKYLETHAGTLPVKSMEPVADFQEQMRTFMAVLMSNPRRMAELQYEYWDRWTNIWKNSLQKMSGEQTVDLYKPEPGDRRFKSAEWNENVLYDFIKQSYLMTTGWLQRVVRTSEGIDQGILDRVDFFTRQMSDAMAPTNFVVTNPDVLRETIRTGGENLVNGLENLIKDMERGSGELKISTTDANAFKLGENIAATKGSVVFQNDLMQLIQYEATTDKVFKTPLLVVPPWINKYYILDMRPENSLVKWLTDQGHTVFIVSWVNPGADLAAKTFDNYMTDGIVAALDHIEKSTGEKSANVMGYCLGGTLLAITLAWLKAKGQSARVASATFLTTLLDFKDAGELKLFTDEAQIEAMEKEMQEKGVLPGDSLQRTFSILRANDMIWSFVVNNYLMGREPFPFDLLYWNQDTTNMPCAMHSFYLRKMYLENKLIEPGGLTIDGVAIDVRDIDAPAYFLSTREDHIAPWKATFAGYEAFTGPKKFTLSASGHVAGVVNPPASGKYGYWTCDKDGMTPDKWLESSAETKGSWWSDWQDWILSHTGAKIKPREIENALEPAPGAYVKK